MWVCISIRQIATLIDFHSFMCVCLHVSILWNHLNVFACLLSSSYLSFSNQAGTKGVRLIDWSSSLPPSCLQNFICAFSSKRDRRMRQISRRKLNIPARDRHGIGFIVYPFSRCFGVSTNPRGSQGWHHLGRLLAVPGNYVYIQVYPHRRPPISLYIWIFHFYLFFLFPQVSIGKYITFWYRFQNSCTKIRISIY